MNILSIVGLAVVGLLMVGLLRQASSEMATLLTMALGVVLFLCRRFAGGSSRSLVDLALRKYPARVYQSDIENRRDIYIVGFPHRCAGTGESALLPVELAGFDNSAYRHPGIQGNSVGP